MEKRIERTDSATKEPPSATTESDKRHLSNKLIELQNKKDDWKWQIRNRIRNIEQLERKFPNMSFAMKMDIQNVAQKYPFAITPYYASLIKTPDYSDPIFKLSVPHIDELSDPTYLSEDPLHENEDMPVPGLVHRYGDRALLMATTTCSMNCRHCTRKRVVGKRESVITNCRLQQTRLYLLQHPEIIDVIISGGDPLTLETSVLESILFMLRQIPSIQIIRIGTRTPVVMPQRITDELVTMLKKYHPVWINTHFNHPQEITPESSAACQKLADAGIPLGNQSVLLKGINDDPVVYAELCRGLLRNRVRPYYLFAADKVKGTYHFHTSIEKGLEIIRYMRGKVSGLGIPTFVVDLPNGRGKIPLLPNYIESHSEDKIIFNDLFGGKIEFLNEIIA